VQNEAAWDAATDNGLWLFQFDYVILTHGAGIRLRPVAGHAKLQVRLLLHMILMGIIIIRVCNYLN